ncbi:phosphate/sulfate permease [Sphingomonas jinjuensis]|uniref:Phosphate/sulfate permease n=1 Tax=Sphingomonas jinjuensis TaxID=535907 RepID=A0A840FAS8_9SPHN|nr:hypothetical protein [Sphingomonas jinjuensis]MBB4152884.1 phosphate/sulfate permease [Sphingomonas jinjuensis]
MDFLALLKTRTGLAQLVALACAALAAIGVLPASINQATQAAIVATGLLVLNAVTLVARFHTGDDGVIEWYQSKTIVTQVVAAVFAVLAFFGCLPADLDQAGVVAGVMGAVALINLVLRKTTTAAIG